MILLSLASLPVPVSPYIRALRARAGPARLLLPSVSVHVIDSDDRPFEPGSEPDHGLAPVRDEHSAPLIGQRYDTAISTSGFRSPILRG